MRNGNSACGWILKKGALLATIFMMGISMIACGSKNNADEKAGVKTESKVEKTDSKSKAGTAKAGETKSSGTKGSEAKGSETKAGKSAAASDNSQVKQEKTNKNSGDEKRKEQADNKLQGTGKTQSAGTGGTGK